METKLKALVEKLSDIHTKVEKNGIVCPAEMEIYICVFFAGHRVPRACARAEWMCASIHVEYEQGEMEQVYAVSIVLDTLAFWAGFAS